MLMILATAAILSFMAPRTSAMAGALGRGDESQGFAVPLNPDGVAMLVSFGTGLDVSPGRRQSEYSTPILN